MNSRHFSLAALLAVVVLAAPVLAVELGDAAPPLKVEKWIKGGPVDLKAGQDKSVYVVEFWATWCAPCRKSIPHMTALQKKYKDKGVVVVGVSIDESEKRKTRDNVPSFVETMGDKMEYAIALDEKDKTTEKAYMDAFLIDGIPCAFVVDKSGKFVWVGHSGDDPEQVPWSNLEKVIDDVLAGKYDLAAAKKADKARRVEAEKMAKLHEQFKKYFELVSSDNPKEGADKLGRDVFALIGKKDADTLNSLAWDILTREGVKYRDLKLALDVGKAAYDACEGKNAAIIDTYAKALFDNGNKKEAIEYEKKAIAAAGKDEDLRQDLEKTLKEYEAAGGK